MLQHTLWVEFFDICYTLLTLAFNENEFVLNAEDEHCSSVVSVCDEIDRLDHLIAALYLFDEILSYLTQNLVYVEWVYLLVFDLSLVCIICSF